MAFTLNPENPLTAAEGDQVVANRGLVALVVRHLRHRSDVARIGDEDDLFQAGFLGLMRAVRQYDPSRGTAFSTLAIPCIKNAIRHAAIHARRWNLGELESDPPAPADDAEDIEIRELAVAVHAAVEALPRREKAIITNRYFEGSTAAAAARSLGVSRQRGNQLQTRAYKLLREELEGIAS